MPTTDLFSRQLRQSCEPDWRRATTHRFVAELANGQISDAAYARYLILDYAFLEILVSHVGQAVSTAPGRAQKKIYTDFLSVLTGDEDDYFLRSFKAMGIDKEDWQKPTSHPVVNGFRDVMLGFDRLPSYAQVLASLLAVEWVYLTWALSVRDQTPQRFYLKEWIDLHTAPEFETFVNWMASEMDRQGPLLEEAERQEVQMIFKRTVDLEIAFFDAAFEMSDD